MYSIMERLKFLRKLSHMSSGLLENRERERPRTFKNKLRHIPNLITQGQIEDELGEKKQF